jgi:hypothetical protein
MKWLRWLEAGIPFFVILGALASGLAASYGRELEASRHPDRNWWIRRLLIMPLLAIAATTATDLFDLSTSTAAFTAAMLSLGGYDVLRLIEAKWRHRLAMSADSSAAPERGP